MGDSFYSEREHSLVFFRENATMTAGLYSFLITPISGSVFFGGSKAGDRKELR